MEPFKGENEKSANLIAELDKKLYSRKDDVVNPERTELHPKKMSVNREWDDEDDPLAYKKPEAIPTASVYSKIFLGSMFFFVIALGAAGYILFSQKNTVSPDNVDVTLSGPVSIKGGDTLSFQVQIENKNTVALAETDLTATFPNGARYSNNPDKTLERYRKSIGAVSAGETRIETVSAILLGTDKDQKSIEVEVDFGLNGGNGSYSVKKTYTVSLSNSPIVVRPDLVKDATDGQEITFSTDVESRSSAVLKNALVRIDYPQGFTFGSADPKPFSGNNIWSLGDMNLGDIKHIAVKGTISGENGQEKIFHVYGGVSAKSASPNIDTLFSTLMSQLTISKPFLGAEILVNRSSDSNYAVTGHQSIVADVSWLNTLADKIENAEIDVTLAGNTIDPSSLEAKDGGLYDSSKNTITWNSRTTSALALINPGGESGTSFTFNLLPFVQNGQVVAKEPTISFDVAVKGNRVSETNVSEKIDSISRRTVKIGTTVEFSSAADYYGKTFKNVGPMPPKVGQETTYTIVWTLRNTVNNISGAKITATLPSYVRFTGQVFPNNAELSSNSTNGTVTWNIGTIKAASGYGNNPTQVAFQVGLTPVTSQASKTPSIISESNFTGTDTWTRLPIEDKAASISTQITTDSMITAGQWSVEQ